MQTSKELLYQVIARTTDNILPGLDTKDFSLPSIAVTDPKQSEIHKAKQLVRGKNCVKSFHYRRQCRNIFDIEQFLIQKGADARQYNICTVIAYQLGMHDMWVNIGAFNYISYYACKKASR